MLNKTTVWATFIILSNLSCQNRQDDKTKFKTSDYSIQIETVFQTDDDIFLQARTAIVSDAENKRSILTMSAHGVGTHAYGDLFFMDSTFQSQRWSFPQRIENLKKRIVDNKFIKVFGDVTPVWHEKSRTVLCTGKTFFSDISDSAYIFDLKKVIAENLPKKRIDIENLQEVAYAVYHPGNNKWSVPKAIDLPEKLDNGDEFYCTNAGCTQWVELPDGDVLLPVRYIKGNLYVSTVILCSYDGQNLKYKKHGSRFTVADRRGLVEPSIASYNGSYFLTMRGDFSAYVAKSNDGLNFRSFREWEFSDGSWLGSYNTQQHWIANSHGLFLVYTRKGANNDHVFRHRAPLFIAQVDPERLCVIKETEKRLMPIPEGVSDLGNFGITYVNDNESWVTAAVTPSKIGLAHRKTKILIAKVKWDN
ncbi:MAG: hypothetical protein AB2L24_26575 [Mangrovibacterium sp.]